MSDQNQPPHAEKRPTENSPDHKQGMRPPVDWHRATTQPTFVVEDSFFRSRTPKPVHWSIAWSDLMMTMFILFLTLFVYQLAKREFLDPTSVEVVAGSVISLPPPSPDPAVPFYPIFPQAPQQDSRPLQSVEQVDENDLDSSLDRSTIPISPIPAEEQPTPLSPEEPPTSSVVPRELVIEDSLQREESLPQPLATPEQTIFTEIYDLSRTTLSEEKLDQFASVELVPDQAVRIILAGDLLFASGKAELSSEAQNSLRKLSKIIAQTPYMINVVGHTDSVPMHSERFPTNWELSVARASRVARFLIEEMKVPGRQVVASGFSYFRPVSPNTTEESRRKNRRVEIILSKEPPPPTRPAIFNQ